jgi:hypothetical protein
MPEFKRMSCTKQLLCFLRLQRLCLDELRALYPLVASHVGDYVYSLSSFAEALSALALPVCRAIVLLSALTAIGRLCTLTREVIDRAKERSKQEVYLNCITRGRVCTWEQIW